jgi:predicted small metal-binding protein
MARAGAATHQSPEIAMAKEVTCPPCGETVRADNDEDLVRKVQQHAKDERGTDLSAEHILASARAV